MPVAEPLLDGWTVLVLENEYFAAEALASALAQAGATVVGPLSAVQEAMQWLSTSEEVLDGAILDVSVRGGLSFEVARELSQRQIAAVFYTGGGGHFIPPELLRVPVILKPARSETLIKALLEARKELQPQP